MLRETMDLRFGDGSVQIRDFWFCFGMRFISAFEALGLNIVRVSRRNPF